MKAVDSWVKGGITKSCWHTHPVFKIGELEISGGSCTNHYAEDHDIFIALDGGGMKGKRSYPWEPGHDVYFRIPDMGVPGNVSDFKKLLKWTIKQMKAGKSVYVGCIGGHGRTGLFLSALYTMITGEKDSIAKVRAEYCHKAVESQKQIDWLNKHFGIKKAKPSKKSFSSFSGASGPWGQKSFSNSWGGEDDNMPPFIEGKVTESKPEKFMSVRGDAALSSTVLHNIKVDK